MTNPLIHGYLEDDYLEDPYLGGTVQDFYGMQVQRVIAAQREHGMQVLRQITDFTHESGMEVNRIVNADHDNGMEVNRVVNALHENGMEVNRIITGFLHERGMEVDRAVGNTPGRGMEVLRIVNETNERGMEVQRIIHAQKPLAMEVQAVILSSETAAMEIRFDHSIAHWLCHELGYLSEPYLTMPYLVRGYCAQSGFEVNRIVNATKAVGMEVNRIVTADKKLGMEVQRVVRAEHEMGMEVNRIIRAEHEMGVEVNRVIRADKKMGMEVLRIIRAERAFGMEVDRMFAKGNAMQVRIVLYNTDKLRILCDFPSRGAETTGGGNNAWGQPRGTGMNWLASTTLAGDFNVNNLNTDIVEQVWRSNNATSAVVTCDTEVNQGVAVDTVGILNHNFTSSAIVTLEASNDSGFSPIAQSIGLSVTPINMYYIAPTFPTQQYRYWRLVISDPTNPQGRLQIGTFVFGSAHIFTKEDLVDEIVRRNKHFADKVNTEGFTNVSNDRALKRAVQLSFDQLAFEKGDINILFEIFEEDRTSLKCLWIPDPKDPKRFAVFGKLATLPDERHKKMGPNEADTVTISIEIDESL